MTSRGQHGHKMINAEDGECFSFGPIFQSNFHTAVTVHICYSAPFLIPEEVEICKMVVRCLCLMPAHTWEAQKEMSADKKIASDQILSSLIVHTNMREKMVLEQLSVLLKFHTLQRFLTFTLHS